MVRDRSYDINEKRVSRRHDARLPRNTHEFYRLEPKNIRPDLDALYATIQFEYPWASIIGPDAIRMIA